MNNRTSNSNKTNANSISATTTTTTTTTTNHSHDNNNNNPVERPLQASTLGHAGSQTSVRKFSFVICNIIVL